MSLDGRIALVTGGGINLGRQIATTLAREGVEVVVCGRRREPLERTVEELRAAGHGARAIVADVTSSVDVARLRTEAGPVDILVNNAGCSKACPWLKVTPEDWREVMAVNLDAPFRLCQLFAPAMVDRGWGRIVNVASVYGSLAIDPSRYPGQQVDIASYAASKHGLIGLTRHLAVMLGTTGVTVNALSPGIFVLPESRLGAKARSRLREGAPVKRTGSDTDLRTTIVFVTSPGSGFVTGQDIVVDGGWSIW